MSPVPGLRAVAGGAVVRQDGLLPNATAMNNALTRQVGALVQVMHVDAAGEPGLRAELRAGASAAECAEALRIVEAQLMPAPSRLVAAELTRLHSVTSGQKMDRATLSTVVEIYAEELIAEGYPVDVVVTACRRGGWDWWPSLEKLKQAANRLVNPRIELARALRNPPRPPEPPRPPPSPADLEHVNRQVRKIAQIIGAKERAAATLTRAERHAQLRHRREQDVIAEIGRSRPAREAEQLVIAYLNGDPEAVEIFGLVARRQRAERRRAREGRKAESPNAARLPSRDRPNGTTAGKLGAGDLV